MADSEAELTLILSARDLASKTVDAFKGSIGGVVGAAQSGASKIGAAFRSVSSGITNGLGNLTESLAQGAGLGEAMFAFGAYMAGQAAESMIGGLLEKMAGSSLVAAIGAPLSAAGSALGGVISAAIPIGMALLPALLVAALVAAVVFLINNPQIVSKVLDVAGSIVRGIVQGLAGLAGTLVGLFSSAVGAVASTVLGLFGAAFRAVRDLVTGIVGGIIDAILGIIAAVKEALHWIGILEGPKVNKIEGLASKTGITGHAEGGWAGLHGPELAWLGEKGPEYVRKAGTGTGDEGGGSGFRIVGVSRAELEAIADQALYVMIQRAAPTLGRT